MAFPGSTFLEDGVWAAAPSSDSVYQQTRPPFGTSECRAQVLGKVIDILEERVWKSSHQTPGASEEML